MYITKRSFFFYDEFFRISVFRTNVLRAKALSVTLLNEQFFDVISRLVNTMKYRSPRQSVKSTEPERVMGKIKRREEISPTDFQRVFPIFRSRVFFRVTIFMLQIVSPACIFRPVNEISRISLSLAKCTRHFALYPGKTRSLRETKANDSSKTL